MTNSYRPGRRPGSVICFWPAVNVPELTIDPTIEINSHVRVSCAAPIDKRLPLDTGFG